MKIGRMGVYDMIGGLGLCSLNDSKKSGSMGGIFNFGTVIEFGCVKS